MHLYAQVTVNAAPRRKRERWRRRLLVPSILCAGALSSPLSAQHAAIVRVTSSNLRARPSTEARIVGRVARGDTVQQLVGREDGWSRVRVGVQEGWMRTSFLVRIEPLPPPPPRADASSPRGAEVPEAVERTSIDTAMSAPSTETSDVDPRLAGRSRARANGKSTIPGSRDPSRLGIMGGVASGSFDSNALMGPALRAYARIPMYDAPLAMRADLEVSRVSARDMSPGDEFTITDLRAMLGADFGVPVSRSVEVFVTGGLGLSRNTQRLRLDLGSIVDALDIQDASWSLAHDIGFGVKLGRILLIESHFLASDGAPYRVLAGIRF